ncbi:kinase-like domain-containing protein, partial [Gautieria morchelliformis]
REIHIWSRLDHESIALFHGFVYHLDGTPAMVLPWYPNGSADVYLRNHPNANPMTLIWQITSGIEYLHDRGVVHGDIKGANVMVDDMGHAKLIDFGLSRVLETVAGTPAFTLSVVSFSIRWCAPELILVENAHASQATDVYAWASTALQVFH